MEFKKVLEEAEKTNIEILSITDHNTVNSYKELKKINIKDIFKGKIILGVEFSTVFDGVMFHLLAYEIFDNVAIYEASKDKLQTSYVTFERFIEGIVTAILQILSYTVLSENDNVIKITFGLAILSYITLGIYFVSKKE